MMLLDEAIQHCLEVAEQKETKAKYCFKTPWESDDIAKDCVKCAEEHRQLAEWLMDYKRLKEERGFLIRNEYRRGWHDALCKALKESYHVQCEGEDFEVVQSKKPTKISGDKWNVAIAIRTADPRSRKIQWRDSGFGVIQDDKVLAWMPLPAPYQPEEETE